MKLLLALGQQSEWKLSELYTKKQGEEKELLEMSGTVSTNKIISGFFFKKYYYCIMLL